MMMMMMMMLIKMITAVTMMLAADNHDESPLDKLFQMVAKWNVFLTYHLNIFF